MLDKIRYTLFSGKNRKFPYYLKGYIRYFTPPIIKNIIKHNTIKKALQKIEHRADKDYILERVNYYNKLSKLTPLPADSPTLKNHTLQKPKVYFFDTYEYTRLFDNTFQWQFLPGDIVHIPPYPSIVKSRPLLPNNENSVIMKLDKIRHFIFLKDKKRFAEKKNCLIFRGKVTGKEIRVRFMTEFLNHPMCDVGDVSKSCPRPEWKTPKMSLWQHLDYKFIMALEGNDVASNLKWIMSSNSLAVMPRPTCETWFMEGKLEPNVHYVAIKEDFSDLEERLNYYIQNPDEAEKIIKNANEYVSQFFDKEREELISIAVLDKYFRFTQS